VKRGVHIVPCRHVVENRVERGEVAVDVTDQSVAHGHMLQLRRAEAN
jgi:hypothetical protein